MEHFAIPSTGREAVSNREHSAQIWENHRERITQLYSSEDRSLDEVVTVMQREHGFTATQRQYKKRISLWHLDKNIKDSEIRFIAQTQVKRAREDKETNFRVRGRDVDPEKISRAVKRKKISEEELLAMTYAPTPSDISYDTPSAVDPRSPYAQQPAVGQVRGQIFDSSHNQVLVPSSWDESEWQNPASFLVSPSYQPATPLPVGWYGPSTSVAPGSFQTPPGILQSPGSLSNTGFVDGMLDTSYDAAYTDHSGIYEIKYARLIELVKETEEIESIDYMKTMSEVNSLVYDLITWDQSRRDMVVEKSSAHSPKCYVCRTLKEIGRETMASKVESERVLLEAIAISEGRFGEDHDVPLHFRAGLVSLYHDWSCRSDSPGNLIRLGWLALRKGPAINGPDFLSDLLNSQDSNELIPCAWLQGPTRESSLAKSSHQLSTLSIHAETIRNSPRNLWRIIEIIKSHVDYIGPDELRDLEPILDAIIDAILRQGPGSVDGSLFFWMATFFSAIYEWWGPIFNSRYLISNTASGDVLPGSFTLKASLEKLCENPCRLEPSAGIGLNGEGSSNARSSDEPSIAKNHSRFEDISKLKGPLENLDQLRLVLAELSWSEIEKPGCDETLASFSKFVAMNPFKMLDTLCIAAQLGNSNLIKLIGMRFGDVVFGGSLSFKDLLNLSDDVGDWWFDEPPLCFAARTGHQLAVEALIDAGADPDGPDEYDETPIWLAAEAGHDAIVSLLVKRGALARFAMSNSNVRALTSIIEILDQGTYEKRLETISENSDLLGLLFATVVIGNMKKYELFAPLSERIRRHTWPKRLDLRLLMYPRARENLLEFLADEDKSSRGLELILNAITGIHIEQQAREILKTALLGSEIEFIKMLDPSRSPDPDQPALHTLVSRNAPNALGVFLELIPNLEASDERGNTALHIAAAQNRTTCAQQLLKHGIDVNVENMSGETALQIAIRVGHTKISEEIRGHSHAAREG